MAKAPWTPIQFDSKLNDTMLVSGEGQYVRTSDHEAIVAEMASELESKDKEIEGLRASGWKLVHKIDRALPSIDAAIQRDFLHGFHYPSEHQFGVELALFRNALAKDAKGDGGEG